MKTLNSMKESMGSELPTINAEYLLTKSNYREVIDALKWDAKYKVKPRDGKGHGA